jgi:hypothetical protein
MRPSYVVTGLIVASGVLLCIAWRTADAVADARSAAVAIEANAAAAERQVLQADRRLTAAQKEVAVLRARRDSVREPGKAKEAGFDPVQWARDYDAQQKDPRKQLAAFAAARAQLRLEYGSLYRSLHLSPEQIAAFEDNVMRSREKLSDLSAALLQAGLIHSDKSFLSAAYRPVEEEFRAAQLQTLGPAAYEEFSNFEKLSSAREKAQRIAGAALVSDVPFSTAQADRLMHAIANASPNYRRGSATVSDIDWDAVDAEARGFLTDAQVQILQQVEPQGGGRRWQQLNAVLQAAQKAEAAAGPAASGR